MYIYHALINALSTHMIHINLNMIFYTHVKHSPTKTIYIKYYLKIKIIKNKHYSYIRVCFGYIDHRINQLYAGISLCVQTEMAVHFLVWMLDGHNWFIFPVCGCIINFVSAEDST